MKHTLFLGYTLFLIIFTLFSYLFIDPNFFYLHYFYTSFFSLHRTVTTILFVLLVVLFFAFYLSFLFLIQKNIIVKKELLYVIGITICALLFSYPAMLSFDIFNYIATAKVAFLYHENPYILMPIEFTHDPLLQFMHAANKTALYAPFWILLTGIPFLLGFGNFLFILFNFKITTVLFYCLITFLLWKMTRSIFKTAFFALNPLVIIETLVSSHNDIVMMFLLLLSLYFFFNKRVGKNIAVYILSVGIKYTTLILLPILPLAFRNNWKQQKLFTWVTILMICVFLLSSLREEIYPWYALWFLVSGTFLIDNRITKYLLVSITFGLLLRYIPFMLLGTYFGPTPILKVMLMSIPITLTAFYFISKQLLMNLKH